MNDCADKVDNQSYFELLRVFAFVEVNPNKHSCHAEWPRPCYPAVSDSMLLSPASYCVRPKIKVWCTESNKKY